MLGKAKDHDEAEGKGTVPALAGAKPLHAFERLARRTVEGVFGRLWPAPATAHSVAAALLPLLDDQRQEGQHVTRCRVIFHPLDLAAFQAQGEDVTAQLGQQLVALARASGQELAALPPIQLGSDQELARYDVAFDLETAPDVDDSTQILALEAAGNQAEAQWQQADAFLIIGGRKHVPLDRPTLTIGRRLSNDIVLESARVSRQHCQLRWRFGRWVLYDLGSRAGTVVNDHPVKESVLWPGDVIRLGDVVLIYGEGMAEGAGQDGEADEDPPTLIFPRSRPE